jgi:sugar-specific transcriptional regulator TrmB
MDVRNKQEPLTTFKNLLINSGVLRYREAEVYVTLVDMGQATAAEIHRCLKGKTALNKIAIQSVHKILERLRKNGFIKSTVVSGKRAHSKQYKANSPEDALKPYFNGTERLKDMLNEVVARLEINEQKSAKVDQSIWLYEPKRIAIREGIKHLKKAKETILLRCNDYTWIQQAGIGEAIMKKVEEGLEVRILGATPKESIQNALIKFNNVRKQTTIPCAPYCLIDREQLLIFFSEGLEHRLMATKNMYMVDHYSAQFDDVWEKHSTEV